MAEFNVLNQSAVFTRNFCNNDLEARKSKESKTLVNFIVYLNPNHYILFWNKLRIGD